MKKVFVVASLLIFIVAVSGCNTMRGLGQDIERGGQAIEKAASK
ncbi:MAG: entericidin A/B family lipoprotein [Syntrophales bacterium]